MLNHHCAPSFKSNCIPPATFDASKLRLSLDILHLSVNHRWGVSIYYLVGSGIGFKAVLVLMPSTSCRARLLDFKISPFLVVAVQKKVTKTWFWFWSHRLVMIETIEIRMSQTTFTLYAVHSFQVGCQHHSSTFYSANTISPSLLCNVSRLAWLCIQRLSTSGKKRRNSFYIHKNDTCRSNACRRMGKNRTPGLTEWTWRGGSEQVEPPTIINWLSLLAIREPGGELNWQSS